MRNLTVYIQYGGSGLSITRQGFEQSFKTKTLESAKEIVARRNKDNIKKAIFMDGEGNKTKII